MKYYKAEFNIECPKEIKQTARELLADSAGEIGFESFEDTLIGINGYIQIELLHKTFVDKIIDEFILDNVIITYSLSGVVDENWNREWESKGFEPIDINEKLLVFDAKKPIPNLDRQIEIGIEAKNAFGTGTHETTQLILSQLVSMNLVNKRVLDCGCGTGILGIAASKLGADEIIAYDIDEWSVKNTEHNSILNGVNNLNVMEGDVSVLSHICGVFDIVMANINRNTLIQDLPKLKEVLNVDGIIILSGFYIDDYSFLIDKAKELGLSEYNKNDLNDWCMIAFK